MCCSIRPDSHEAHNASSSHTQNLVQLFSVACVVLRHCVKRAIAGQLSLDSINMSVAGHMWLSHLVIVHSPSTIAAKFWGCFCTSSCTPVWLSLAASDRPAQLQLQVTYPRYAGQNQGRVHLPPSSEPEVRIYPGKLLVVLLKDGMLLSDKQKVVKLGFLLHIGFSQAPCYCGDNNSNLGYHASKLPEVVCLWFHCIICSTQRTLYFLCLPACQGRVIVPTKKKGVGVDDSFN